jgi:hypothetical protein
MPTKKSAKTVVKPKSTQKPKKTSTVKSSAKTVKLSTSKKPTPKRTVRLPDNTADKALAKTRVGNRSLTTKKSSKAIQPTINKYHYFKQGVLSIIVLLLIASIGFVVYLYDKNF